MGRVYANGRSILHKGDGNTHTSAAPDVCKVPTPGGPVPTPFVNSAQDSMLTKGSTSVTIEGNPVALTSSELSTSTGDEPGTAGGLISSKFKGKMAWGSGSVDVKVEGKGVVRYLDVTLHNGNTYNTTFISDGRTAWAYGDDAQCTACDKSLDEHRVHETDDVVVHMDTFFADLMKEFHRQRPFIAQYSELKQKRKVLNEKSLNEFHDAALRLTPKKQRLNELREVVRSPAAADKSTIKDQLIPLQEEVKAAEQAAKKKRKLDIENEDALTREMNVLKSQLESMPPLLRWHEDEKNYTKGYMIGVLLCRCAKKALIAISGSDVTPGFRQVMQQTIHAAHGTSSFELVESFQMSDHQEQVIDGRERNWECAAPKLIQAGGAAGHKARTMSERWFSPMGTSTSAIQYSHTDVKGTAPKSREFGHGETVVSCKECQELLPEMLCDNTKECA
ncbi:DUF4150 domain-containing protein [Myxococcus eversor]|uniref:DUF4150 domain-containing protein n=1 Tax=Myxococcus eversor TaxID=2709661 RepID=UPI0013D7285B|nr:DUF4150 domain-containing protein [Myxococcus eversor]